MVGERALSTGQTAKRLGISVRTIYRWETVGRLVPISRLPSGQRRFSSRDVDALLRSRTAGAERCAVYARVSSEKQAEAGNLEPDFDSFGTKRPGPLCTLRGRIASPSTRWRNCVITWYRSSTGCEHGVARSPSVWYTPWYTTVHLSVPSVGSPRVHPSNVEIKPPCP